VSGGHEGDVEIKAALALALGDRRAEGQGKLLEIVFDDVERAIRLTLERAGLKRAELVDETTVRFFERKLTSRDFLERLSEVDAPLAFVRTSARHFALDVVRSALRSDPGLRVRVEELSENDAAESTSDGEIEESRVRMARLCEEALAAIEPSKRALLKLLERIELSSEEISEIARHRGISSEDLERELAAFESDRNTRRSALEEDLVLAHSELLSLEEEHRFVLEVIRQLDREPTKPEREELRRPASIAVLQGATPGQRSGHLARLEEKLASEAARYAEIERQLRAPRPQYRRIVFLLGEVGAGATEAEIARAENRITLRAIRTRKKLKEQVEAAAGKGGRR
jgi:hypothetical protein